MTRKFILTTALGAMLALAACNTVNGAGEDLQSAGGAVSDASGENAKK
ncbi:entericidin A/B family lipoprotein [Sphingomonas sp.]|jgi:predicted small secreted protein